MISSLSHYNLLFVASGPWGMRTVIKFALPGSHRIPNPLYHLTRSSLQLSVILQHPISRPSSIKVATTLENYIKRELLRLDAPTVSSITTKNILIRFNFSYSFPSCFPRYWLLTTMSSIIPRQKLKNELYENHYIPGYYQLY